MSAEVDERPYQTLADFQQAHESLLERFDADSGDAAGTDAAGDAARERARLVALMEPLREFLRRASAGGAYLYENRERRAAQGLLDYWASLCYGANLDVPRPLLAPHDPALLPRLDDADCPYVGLEAFGELNAANFFGREERVQALLKRLETERLLVVTGASGSGKSSLVLAGLLPALRAGGLPGSAGWCYPPALVPGATPLAALVAALLPDEGPGPSLRQDVWLLKLRERPEAVRELLGDTPAVLVVDQFEEVMTLRSEDNAADYNAFVAALQSLVDAPSPRHRLVLTMRNDVDNQLAREYPELNRRYGTAAFPLVSMDSVQLREAIEGPARRAGLKFQAGVVDELIRSVVGEDAGLPLLQFSLMALWDRRHGNLVTLDALRAVGSPRRAMTVAAEGLYQELSPEQQQTAGHLFLALSRPGEGVTVFRNRVSRRRLHEVGEPNLVDRVVQRFEQARLLRVTRREQPADDLVEVAHEALLRNWELLQGLFSERRDERERRAFLRKQAQKWREAGFDDAFLLSGLALKQATEEVSQAGMSEVERNFLAKSVEYEGALERQREEERLRLTRLYEQEVVAAKRVRRSALGLAAAVAVAIALLGVATYRWRSASEDADAVTRAAQASTRAAQLERERLIAEANRRVAESQLEADKISASAQVAAAEAAAAEEAAKRQEARATTQLTRSESARLLSEAAASVDNDSELAVFYAAEAVRRDRTLLPRAAPLVVKALGYRRPEMRLMPIKPGGPGASTPENTGVLALSPPGDRLLVVDSDQLSEWNLGLGDQPPPRRDWHHSLKSVQQVVYAGDSGQAALATDERVWLWRPGTEPIPLEPKLAVSRMTASLDGRWLAVLANEGRSLKVWSVPDLALRMSYEQSEKQPRMSAVIFDEQQTLVVALVPDRMDPRSQALRFERKGDGFAAEPALLRGSLCSGPLNYAAGGARVGLLTTPVLCVQDVAKLKDDKGQAEGNQQTEAVDDIVVSPAGRYVVKLLRGTGDAVVEEQSSGRTLRLQAAFDLSKQNSYEEVMSISDAGERLAIKGQDGSVRIYRLGDMAHELAGRNGVTWVSDDDRWFITKAPVAGGFKYELREMASGRPVYDFARRGAPIDPGELSLSGDGRWLQLRAACDRRGIEPSPAQTAEEAVAAARANAGRQVLVFDVMKADAPPVASPCVQNVGGRDGLYVLFEGRRSSVYAAALQRVVWPAADVAQAAGPVRLAGDAPGLNVLIGEDGRFVVRSVSKNVATVESYRVTGDAARLERSWQWPAAAGWAARLLGGGRALWITPATADEASELWDLRVNGASPLRVAGRRTEVFLGKTGSVLASRSTRQSDWELLDVGTGRSRGSLPSWMRIEPTGRIAYGFNDGHWQLRRLDAPDRILLQGEGQPDAWLFDRQGMTVALNFLDSNRQRVYRLSDGQLRLDNRFYGLRDAKLTGGGGYVLTEEGRLLPADGEVLLQAASAAVARRFGSAERCQLLMDEVACRETKEADAKVRRSATVSRASTSP